MAPTVSQTVLVVFPGITPPVGQATLPELQWRVWTFSGLFSRYLFAKVIVSNTKENWSSMSMWTREGSCLTMWHDVCAGPSPIIFHHRLHLLGLMGVTVEQHLEGTMFSVLTINRNCPLTLIIPPLQIDEFPSGFCPPKCNFFPED